MAAAKALRTGSSDPDWIMFILCKEFGWLPSQIEGEDWLILRKFLQYLQYEQKFRENEMSKAKARRKK